MMHTSVIQTIYEQSFRANIYTYRHFRMIGLIDVQIDFKDYSEKVTLAYYSSSGTNSGKIKGLWYPIVGIKLVDGPFTEFTPTLNQILSHTTLHGDAEAGWLAKSLFFSFSSLEAEQLRGFADIPYYPHLLNLGEKLRTLYTLGNFQLVQSLEPDSLNAYLTAETVYPNNTHTQRENFENFMNEIYQASIKKMD